MLSISSAVSKNVDLLHNQALRFVTQLKIRPVTYYYNYFHSVFRQWSVSERRATLVYSVSGVRWSIRCDNHDLFQADTVSLAIFYTSVSV